MIGCPLYGMYSRRPEPRKSDHGRVESPRLVGQPKQAEGRTNEPFSVTGLKESIPEEFFPRQLVTLRFKQHSWVT